MRYLISFFALSVLFYPVTAVSASDMENQEADRPLILYNWPDYMPDDLLEAFAAETGKTVRVHFYSSDEAKQNLLAKTGGAGLDLIIGSGATMREYVAPGWIQPLDSAQLGNRDHLSRAWLRFVPELQSHAVPLLWGTLGIAYRSDLVPNPPASWAEFFAPDVEVGRRVMLVDDSADVFGVAQIALGLSLNPGSKADLDAAFRLLMDFSQNVYQYAYPRLDRHSELLKGKVAMAMLYSGDAITLRKMDPRIEYVHPSDGTNLWVDYIAVASQTNQSAAAHRFINFLLRPENAIFMAEALHYGSTQRDARIMSSETHRSSQIIYPDSKVLGRAESYTRAPADLLRHRNQLFAELKK